MDPLHVPSGYGKGVVAAHGEPPRRYYEAHPFHTQWFGYSLMGSFQRDAVRPLQTLSAALLEPPVSALFTVKVPLPQSR